MTVGADGTPWPAPDGDHIDRVISYRFAASHALLEMALTSSSLLHPYMLIEAAKSEGGVDDALIAAANAEPHVRAVWRSYRFAIELPQRQTPKSVFVVETDREADLPEITGRIQDALAATGEEYPRVEVYPVHAEPPPYQRCARLAGGLIWARAPDPGIHISRIFDAIEDDGEVRMAPDHPRLDTTESGRVLTYLDRGEVLLMTPTRVADIVDPTQGAAVPVTLRTDGYWIWSDATAYYLRRHALAPQPELMEHIRQRGYTAPEEVDGAAMYRALVALHTFGAEKSSIREVAASVSTRTRAGHGVKTDGAGTVNETAGRVS
jgi:hypothetical protein